MSQNPIAVTGMGCVSPCGSTTAQMWASLLEGRSGIAPITRFSTEGFDVHIAGEVKDFEPAIYGLDSKDARRLDRFVQLALAASQEAVQQSGLLKSEYRPSKVGVIVGTGIGGICSIESQMDILRAKGPSRVSPLLVPSGTPDVPSNEIALLFGFKGPSFAVSTACSSGSDAVVAAARCILDGTADAMIAGGAEAPIGELAIASFANLRALSRSQAPPEQVCRPFDRDRSGFVLAEGAGILVLESLAHARRRGARVLALLAGWGQSTDAYHKTAPDPTGAGAASAIEEALHRAGVTPEEVGYINAHGTSTTQNDPMETLAIKTALGEHARRIPISSTKSMTGHMIAAAGAIEGIVAAMATMTGRIPPTINYATPDPDCDLDYVPNHAIERRVDVAISNSFGFGGHNASLLFRSAGG